MLHFRHNRLPLIINLVSQQLIAMASALCFVAILLLTLSPAIVFSIPLSATGNGAYTPNTEGTATSGPTNSPANCGQTELNLITLDTTGAPSQDVFQYRTFNGGQGVNFAGTYSYSLPNPISNGGIELLIVLSSLQGTFIGGTQTYGPFIPTINIINATLNGVSITQNYALNGNGFIFNTFNSPFQSSATSAVVNTFIVTIEQVYLTQPGLATNSSCGVLYTLSVSNPQTIPALTPAIVSLCNFTAPPNTSTSFISFNVTLNGSTSLQNASATLAQLSSLLTSGGTLQTCVVESGSASRSRRRLLTTPTTATVYLVVINAATTDVNTIITTLNTNTNSNPLTSLGAPLTTPVVTTSVPAVPAAAIPAAPTPTVRGDPQFVGLRGQSYQIHGVDGAIYNIISHPTAQVNARFAFLTGPRTCPIMPSTTKRSVGCFSHPGSYLSEIGVVVSGHRLQIVAGAADYGFQSVIDIIKGADDDMSHANSVVMQVSNQTTLLQYTTTHELTFSAGPFTVSVENIDGFVNIRTVDVANDKAANSAHGLLGQTWNGQVYKNKLKYIQGEVDDYVIEENDIFGTAFLYNRYNLDTK